MSFRFALFGLAISALLTACGGSVSDSPAASGDTGTDGAASDGASSDTGGGTDAIVVETGMSGLCGGKTGAGCPSDMFCFYEKGTCRNPDQTGVCRERVALPCAAPMPGEEVCGCDGKTYGNSCVAISSGMSIDHDGTCDTSTAKVCGGLAGVECDPTEYCDWGALPSLCGGDDGTGICKKRPTSCIPADGIFCGCDGKTYESPCAAGKAGTGLRKNGPC